VSGESFGVGEQRRRRRNALIIALLMLGPLGWLTARELQLWREKNEARLSPSQRAELEELLDAREALAQASIVRWNASYPSVEARVGGEPCPVTLTPPAQLSAGAYVKYATHDASFGAWSLCILREGRDPCARTYQTPATVTKLRARLAEADVYSWDLDEAKAAAPQVEPLRVVVVPENEVPAQVESTRGGHLSFVPGTLAGRVLLYSPERGRFICGGTVSVRNSKSVEVEYSHFGDDPAHQEAEAEGRAALERDLEMQLRFALTRVLRLLEQP
jgi:hypothetical protein